MREPISAVLCTLNRMDYLKKALASLEVQSLSKDQYQIVVVDNGSTDGTKEYLLEQTKRIDNLTCLHEPEPGLSKARNLGWREAKGSVVAFLDDDAMAAKDWLEKIGAAFERLPESVVALGGKVDPVWEMSRPAWLADRHLGALAIIDWSKEPAYLQGDQYLVGANMAFRKAGLVAVEGFPEELGRKGKKLLSGEETYVTKRLEAQGHKTYYDPAVCVCHHVQAERLQPNWFFRRAYWQGVSSAGDFLGSDGKSFIRQIRRAVRMMLALVFRSDGLWATFSSRGNSKGFDRKCTMMARLGYLQRLLRLI